MGMGGTMTWNVVVEGGGDGAIPFSGVLTHHTVGLVRRSICVVER